jgi:hypothetical protein
MKKEKKIRLPRKAKKKLIEETARSEYFTQRNMISMRVLRKFVL